MVMNNWAFNWEAFHCYDPACADATFDTACCLSSDADDFARI